MKLTYNKRVVFNTIFLISMFVSTGFSAPGITTEIVAWEDGFEGFLNPAFGGFQSHVCGTSINGFLPPFSPGLYKSYSYTGPSSAAPLIDCTFACTGSQSIQTRHSDDGSGGFWARPQYPFPFFHPGETWVFEEDIYIPLGGAAEFWIHSGSQANGDAAGWRASSGEPWRWAIGTFADPPEARFGDPNVGDEVFVQTNIWNHVRMEIYDEPGQPFSIWVTPKDGNDITYLVVDKTPSPVGVWAGGIHFFPWYLGRGGGEDDPNADETYRDNIKQTRIDLQSQGFPVIGKAPVGIVIDGTMATGEWDEVVKVAEKPLNEHGDFEPLWAGNFDYLLDPATFVEVYTAFDDDYFYIAGRFNNAVINPVTDPEVLVNQSFFEAVFNWDFENVADDVGYTYSVNAYTAADPNTGSHLKYVMDPLSPPSDEGVPVGPVQFTAPDDPNAFRDNGGIMAYTVVGGIMEIEMKIPFADLPDFTGPVAGDQINLQFNVSGISGGWLGDGLNSYTTNVGMERYPWSTAFVDSGYPFAAGVTFAACLDGSVPKNFPVGDFSQDCQVTLPDLVTFVENWLETIPPGVAAVDLSGDLKVDLTDYSEFASRWMESLLPI